jgi:hypothetical protein
VLVAGQAIKPVDMGGGVLPALGGADMIVAKYASASPGAHQWSKRGGGTSNDYGYGVAADSSSNVYVAGSFESASVSIAGSTLTNGGNSDTYVAKWASDGSNAAARKLGGTGQDVPNKIVAQASGHLAVCGYFYNAGSFDGTTLTSAGLADGFLVRMAQ